MKSTLSPRELALAIGVSESTLKRWIDAGRVEARRTAGGHRRVPVEEAVRFLRKSGRTPEHPDRLGLFPVAGRGLEGTAEQFYELSRAGRSSEACRLLLSAWVAGSDIAELCDLVIRPSLIKVGDAWDGGTSGVYVEHRASSIAVQALDRLTPFLDIAPDSIAAPVAMGGAVSGDPSTLPSLMASTVLTTEGFRAVNLGANTPIPAFLEAVDDVNPRLVWISASYLDDPVRQREELVELLAVLRARRIGAVIGGLAVGGLNLESSELIKVGADMRELVKLARELLNASAQERSRPEPGTNGGSNNGGGNGRVPSTRAFF